MSTEDNRPDPTVSTDGPGLPSAGAIASGKRVAEWGPDPSAIPPEGQPRESVFGIVEVSKALDLAPATRDGARRWFAGEATYSDAELTAKDAAHRSEAEAELRALWKGDYYANLRTISSFLGTLPGGAGDAFHHARGQDGRAFGNDPDTLQRVLGAAKRRGNLDLSADVNEQIKAIEMHMRTNRRAYDRDALLHARYRELLSLRGRA